MTPIPSMAPIKKGMIVRFGGDLCHVCKIDEHDMATLFTGATRLCGQVASPMLRVWVGQLEAYGWFSPLTAADFPPAN